MNGWTEGRMQTRNFINGWTEGWITSVQYQQEIALKKTDAVTLR